MVTAGPPPPPSHPDWRHGYSKPLEQAAADLAANGRDVTAWLIAELRLRCYQLATAEQERLAERNRAEDREHALRHRLAHELADRLWSLKLGTHATKGARAVLDLIHPISRCPADCTGEQP
jgi:hypothetical protein